MDKGSGCRQRNSFTGGFRDDLYTMYIITDLPWTFDVLSSTICRISALIPSMMLYLSVTDYDHVRGAKCLDLSNVARVVSGYVTIPGVVYRFILHSTTYIFPPDCLAQGLSKPSWTRVISV